ncbi:zinc-binding dehydrogenase [Solihabitans fulvus]|uniref:Zinc-binding dehydrogenase n=1 Tax=Solihabitans fulvus TaxID=1892852 RepID=A0A5B2XA36_9PSEU|nr:zinc-binding dehydrogenase [Solihabitans fulvus]KAA2260437.1 zinc-binding dehydrogenase [Solihabitans fulvus]
MRALVVDPTAPSRLRLGEAPDPVPGPGQVLIEVRHSSLNSAELFFAERSEPGTVLGFDASGIVLASAADGGGPSVGSRVVSFADGGGWAERRAVDAIDVAVVPDLVDLGVAATLPVAAGTALRALEQAGPITGRRVLVTGASGGVGSFAVQLAAIGGAHVIASVGSAASGGGLTELGAAEVVIGLAGMHEPVDVVIDLVGGPQLVAAYGLLSSGGSVQSVGWASGEAAAFPPGATLGRPNPTSITSVYNGAGLTDRRRQLQVLLDLLASGRLRAQVGWRGPWEGIDEAVTALSSRVLRGKAVLDVVARSA